MSPSSAKNSGQRLLNFQLPAVDSQIDRTFGGQVVAQTLAAATTTVEPARPVLSLHGYFIGPGDSRRPLDARVEVLRDGGIFSSRRVIVTQDARTVFLLTANFSGSDQTGPAHSDAMPEVPAPDMLAGEHDLLPPGVHLSDWEEWSIRLLPEDTFPGPTRGVWFRSRASQGESQQLHRQLVAYMSDMTLPYMSLKGHPVHMNEALSYQIASLDHGMWFYSDVDTSMWLLYLQHSPVAKGGTGLNVGKLFNQDGDLLAVTQQQTMIRHHR